MAHRSNSLFHQCVKCQKSFYVNPAYLKRRKNACQYCSRSCWRDAITSKEKVIYQRPDGYLVQNKRFIHRIIMEKHLSRKLSTKEHVHHINGIKSDNRVLNLTVLSDSEHRKLHARDIVKKGSIYSCQGCGKEFYCIPSRSGLFCSSNCYWKAKKNTKRWSRFTPLVKLQTEA